MVLMLAKILESLPKGLPSNKISSHLHPPPYKGRWMVRVMSSAKTKAGRDVLRQGTCPSALEAGQMHFFTGRKVAEGLVEDRGFHSLEVALLPCLAASSLPTLRAWGNISFSEELFLNKECPRQLRIHHSH